MRFGLFYEIQVPKPPDRETWNPDDEHRKFKQALDQIELADRLGFDYVFVVEHHFLEEYSHCSAPEVFLGAVSQRTKRIRLGHGIMLTPPPVNHPARVAERIATLDLLSDGRVEFGSGESSSDMELGGFGVDRAAKKAMWEEGLREILAMLGTEPYPGVEGEFFRMPERNVVPKPYQRPHPPLWVAASRRETVLVAARLGMGSLGFAFDTPDETRERVESYYRLMREECFPIGKTVNPAVAMVSTLLCARTDQDAMAKAWKGGPFFAFALNYYYASPEPHTPGRKHLWREFMKIPVQEHLRRMQQQPGGAMGAEASYDRARSVIAAQNEPSGESARAIWRAARRGPTIGAPEWIRKSLREYENAHLDLMILGAQSGMVAHEDVMASLELFAREVMPEFQERHARHLEWRQEQLRDLPHPVHSTI